MADPRATADRYAEVATADGNGPGVGSGAAVARAYVEGVDLAGWW